MEKIYFDIKLDDEPVKASSLISELEEVSKQRDLILGEKPKVKKEKKKKDKSEKEKKKKKDNVELDLIGLDQSSMNVDDPDEYTAALLDVEAMFNDEIEYDEDGNIVSSTIIESQRDYKKQKKNENEYRKEFAEEITLLYDLLKDTGRVSTDIDKMIKSTDGSRVRGLSKNMNELLNSKISTISAQMSIIKEINNVKSKAIDLKIKSDAKKKDSEGEQNFALMSASYLQNIMKSGNRGAFMQSVRGSSGYLPQTSSAGSNDDDVYSDSIIDYDGVTQVYTDDETAQIEDLIERRLREEGNNFRSVEGDKNIEYETRGVEIKIRLYVDTGEWEFFAVDRDNIRVYDYPLPRPEDAKPIKFNGHIATDRRGLQYRVMEAYSNEM